jgi:hypothetical protein
MSRKQVVVPLAALTFFVGVSTAQAAKYDFRVSPRVGKPTTAFVVSFKAPYAADGDVREYFLDAIGPPKCAQLFDFSGRAILGQRERLRLTPQDVALPTFRSRWCRGRYVGVVTYDDDTKPNSAPTYIGYVRFRVR